MKYLTRKTDYGTKIKEIKEAENLSDPEMAGLLGISPGDLGDCEEGRLISLTIISHLTRSECGTKYAMWLMTNRILPETGQISPELARYGPG